MSGLSKLAGAALCVLLLLMGVLAGVEEGWFTLLGSTERSGFRPVYLIALSAFLGWGVWKAPRVERTGVGVWSRIGSLALFVVSGLATLLTLAAVAGIALNFDQLESIQVLKRGAVLLFTGAVSG